MAEAQLLRGHITGGHWQAGRQRKRTSGKSGNRVPTHRGVHHSFQSRPFWTPTVMRLPRPSSRARCTRSRWPKARSNVPMRTSPRPPSPRLDGTISRLNSQLGERVVGTAIIAGLRERISTPWRRGSTWAMDVILIAVAQNHSRSTLPRSRQVHRLRDGDRQFLERRRVRFWRRSTRTPPSSRSRSASRARRRSVQGMSVTRKSRPDTAPTCSRFDRRRDRPLPKPPTHSVPAPGTGYNTPPRKRDRPPDPPPTPPSPPPTPRARQGRRTPRTPPPRGPTRPPASGTEHHQRPGHEHRQRPNNAATCGRKPGDAPKPIEVVFMKDGDTATDAARETRD